MQTVTCFGTACGSIATPLPDGVQLPTGVREPALGGGEAEPTPPPQLLGIATPPEKPRMRWPRQDTGVSMPLGGPPPRGPLGLWLRGLALCGLRLRSTAAALTTLQGKGAAVCGPEALLPPLHAAATPPAEVAAATVIVRAGDARPLDAAETACKGKTCMADGCGAAMRTCAGSTAF